MQTEDYVTYKAGWLLQGDDGFLSWEDGRPVDAQVRDYMVRKFYRHPVHILKAWQAHGSKAVHLGGEKIDGAAVEKVAVAVRGAITTLTVDSNSGRILRAAYRGRAGVGIARVEEHYSDFREVNGLTAPFKVSTRDDDKEVTNPGVVISSVRVNEKLDPALLTKPV